MDIQYQGYYPGVVGKITEVHAVYYHENWGFDVSFETQVGRELSEFISEFEEQRDGLWIATKATAFAGSVAIDGRERHTEGARLRWFIVVPEFQKAGIGKELISRAVQYCRDKRYPKMYLWTFEGLDSARRLYEHEGLQLKEEQDVAQWGQYVKEQKFELILENQEKRG